jgi:hypothetical protein
MKFDRFRSILKNQFNKNYSNKKIKRQKEKWLPHSFFLSKRWTRSIYQTNPSTIPPKPPKQNLYAYAVVWFHFPFPHRFWEIEDPKKIQNPNFKFNSMATRNRTLEFRKHRDTVKSLRTPLSSSASASSGGPVIEMVNTSLLRSNNRSSYTPLSTQDPGPSSSRFFFSPFYPSFSILCIIAIIVI